MRVLIVDADPDAVQRLATALVHHEIQVRAVASAGEATDAVASFDPDVLVVAAALPDLDGLELTRRTVRSEFPRRPAVILTGPHRPDEEASRAAGVDWHLPAPGDPRRLLVLVGAYDEYLRKVITEDELEDTGWRPSRRA